LYSEQNRLFGCSLALLDDQKGNEITFPKVSKRYIDREAPSISF